MEIVVFGAGSLGSLVGGVLAREHDVTLVARQAHADAVRTRGLRIEGSLEAEVSPAATTDGRGLEADLAVVTVKSFDTESIAETIATGSFDAVLSLQNGMGNEEVLASALDAEVLAGTATYGAILQRPGIVECTGLGKIVLGDHRGGHSDVADAVGEAFSGAGLETTVAEDMPSRLWEKLAVNAGINAITALTETENRAVLEPPADDVARAATKETARVARADGVELSNREALAAMERVAESTAANTSSMAQDLQVGRRTEIDAINGYVVDRGETLAVETPTNRLLAALVRTWERGQGVRDDSLAE
ncbi:ketopantoate reductase family protein [Natronobacterium texcoconense]|uniref:2-dehydropantoate 2-reductase n=1 Tax=Natronobacterium texcoconense TaxID=1095778 RepID=A0A1H1HRZ8_NATTX|nr:2-dehydropantoate 2-reductase [Natronobacterium texcoconense]SDR28119.1 ketopantoate reductase [Natronobacterium texcoconense]